MAAREAKSRAKRKIEETDDPPEPKKQRVTAEDSADVEAGKAFKSGLYTALRDSNAGIMWEMEALRYSNHDSAMSSGIDGAIQLMLDNARGPQNTVDAYGYYFHGMRAAPLSIDVLVSIGDDPWLAWNAVLFREPLHAFMADIAYHINTDQRCLWIRKGSRMQPGSHDNAARQEKRAFEKQWKNGAGHIASLSGLVDETMKRIEIRIQQILAVAEHNEKIRAVEEDAKAKLDATGAKDTKSDDLKAKSKTKSKSKKTEDDDAYPSWHPFLKKGEHGQPIIKIHKWYEDTKERRFEWIQRYPKVFEEWCKSLRAESEALWPHFKEAWQHVRRLHSDLENARLFPPDELEQLRDIHWRTLCVGYDIRYRKEMPVDINSRTKILRYERASEDAVSHAFKHAAQRLIVRDWEVASGDNIAPRAVVPRMTNLRGRPTQIHARLAQLSEPGSHTLNDHRYRSLDLLADLAVAAGACRKTLLRVGKKAAERESQRVSEVKAQKSRQLVLAKRGGSLFLQILELIRFDTLLHPLSADIIFVEREQKNPLLLSDTSSDYQITIENELHRRQNLVAFNAKRSFSLIMDKNLNLSFPVWHSVRQRNGNSFRFRQTLVYSSEILHNPEIESDHLSRPMFHLPTCFHLPFAWFNQPESEQSKSASKMSTWNWFGTGNLPPLPNNAVLTESESDCKNDPEWERVLPIPPHWLRVKVKAHISEVPTKNGFSEGYTVLEAAAVVGLSRSGRRLLLARPAHGFEWFPEECAFCLGDFHFLMYWRGPSKPQGAETGFSENKWHLVTTDAAALHAKITQLASGKRDAWNVPKKYHTWHPPSAVLSQTARWKPDMDMVEANKRRKKRLSSIDAKFHKNEKEQDKQAEELMAPHTDKPNKPRDFMLTEEQLFKLVRNNSPRYNELSLGTDMLVMRSGIDLVAIRTEIVLALTKFRPELLAPAFMYSLSKSSKKKHKSLSVSVALILLFLM